MRKARKGEDVMRQARQEHFKSLRNNDYPEGATSRKEWWDARQKASDKDTAEKAAYVKSTQGRIELLERSIAAWEAKRVDMGLSAMDVAIYEGQKETLAKLKAAQK